MSIFGKLFGQRPRQPDKSMYMNAMIEMASESERVYRGMIGTYNSDLKRGRFSAQTGNSAISPSSRGVFKARLFGAAFMLVPYIRSGASEEEWLEMVSVAGGIAIEPLQNPGDLYLDSEEANTFADGYVAALIKSITKCFEAGPCLPDSPDPAHLALAEHLHNALAESIGSTRYTIEVHKRFGVPAVVNTILAMNQASRYMAR